MAGATLSLYAVPALLVTLLGFFALAASVLQRRIPKDTNALADRIERMLPLTQCAQCGHPGCRPYAEAVAAGEAIDLCPPGGVELIAQLKDLMGDDAPQSHGDMATAPPIVVAVIDEAACIGCTLCLDPCPVDAIVGAQGFMHTVIEQECTGCELCIAPCPVDCDVKSFTAWTTCTKSCEGGSQRRFRAMVQPRFGGDACLFGGILVGAP